MHYCVQGPGINYNLSSIIANQSLIVSWTTNSQSELPPWDFRLSCQKVGIGDCETFNESEVLYVNVSRTESSYR